MNPSPVDKSENCRRFAVVKRMSQTTFAPFQDKPKTPK